jgi:hypothetical protein
MRRSYACPLSERLFFSNSGEWLDQGFWIAWLKVETAPFNCDLEVAVINPKSTHVLEFPCRRIFGGGWVDATSREMVEVYPTHRRLRPVLDSRN